MNKLGEKSKEMSWKKILGFILLVVYVIVGCLILVKLTSLWIVFSMFGVTMIVLVIFSVITWLISEEE